MKSLFDYFRRSSDNVSDFASKYGPEAAIQSAIALQEFDMLLEQTAPFLIDTFEGLTPSQAAVLKSLQQDWGSQFILLQLFAAFIRGWRSGGDGERAASARSEVEAELRFLTEHNLTDVGLRGARNINEYFCDAVWLYMKTDLPSARLAAFTAGIVAQDNQRESLVGYLTEVADEWRRRSPATTSVADNVDALAVEIIGEDWTVEETIYFKEKLKEIDPEFFYCLAASDPSVFRARFPKIFADHDIWFAQSNP